MSELLPTTAGGWIGLLTTVVVGIFALITLLDRSSASRRKEKDELDEGLITSLKETIAEMSRKIDVLENNQKENVASINQLLGENNIMKRLLENRDERSLAAQAAAIETNQLIKHLTTTFDAFMKQQTKNV